MRNFKANRLCHLFKHDVIDVTALQEVCVNWSSFMQSQKLSTFFSEIGYTWYVRWLRTMSPRPKYTARKQRGGTGTVVLDVLTLYVKDSWVCHTGLGRYSWYKEKGEPGHKIYFISAYAPCGNDPMGKEAAYQQQARYIKQHGLQINPRAYDFLTLAHKGDTLPW